MTTPNRPRPLSDLLPSLTSPAFGKKSALFGKLLAQWPHIVGPDVARIAMPTELKFKRQTDKSKAAQAVLYLAVEGSGTALELSYQKPLLLERINIFFGYKAVVDIEITTGLDITDNKKPAKALFRPLKADETAKIDAVTAVIQETDLQTALKNLGKAILSRRRTTLE